ncbi:DUF3039 domain-containing protein [Corynebacterium freiburgense]|uniref:DUF3039 domain-containing protein n=1 Tax=Corynebacterium freiburgense TaxID=556548 RepID=UPI000429502E|nr:DUF3039 domain-containing protein [Corynebacterium freiburgense]WJZ01666.1 hypothetical protein CFREI_01810 [Corynebacterium freiburgense]
MTNLRARPTLRVLDEDLNVDGRFSSLVEQLRCNPSASQSICDIDHPIIRKAGQCFGDDPTCDMKTGIVKGATRYTVYKLRESQWRGGVWKDAEGVNWLIIAGLAKGEHEDYNDIYKKIARAHKNEKTADLLKPRDEDYAILKAENVVRRLHKWKLTVQEATKNCVEESMSCSTASFDIVFPPELATTRVESERILSKVTIQFEADDSGIFELEVLFEPNLKWRNSGIFEVLKIQVLNSILPPLHRWDLINDCRFFTLDEEKVWQERLQALKTAVEKKVLQPTVKDPNSHYLHKADIVESSINGTAQRALCGVYVVSTRNADAIEPCPECQRIYNQLPV